MKSVFNFKDIEEVTNRINNLNPYSQRSWGKMNVAQMLAHCNVTYEQIYENKYPEPKGILRLILKWFVKNSVVNNRPYKQNAPTSPIFLIKGDKDFETEKIRLLNYIKRTQELGEKYFDQRRSHSFGNLNVEQWNNLMYKHLDHHLKQFGV